MVPIFKSQYSVGKSILQTETIIKLAKEAELEKVIVVEDSFYGFRELNQKCLEEKLPLIFGIKLPVVYESFDEHTSQLIFFAKNNEGLRKAKDLYSKTYLAKEGVLKFSEVKGDLKDITVAVPFYDSFVYNNVFHFGMSMMDLDEVEHFFIKEENGHPFDFQINRALEKMNIKPILVKTICYENREDFEAFQMLRAISSRSHGKTPTFGNPNLNHFCSQEFCWESWKENANA